MDPSQPSGLTSDCDIIGESSSNSKGTRCERTRYSASRRRSVPWSISRRVFRRVTQRHCRPKMGMRSCEDEAMLDRIFMVAQHSKVPALSRTTQPPQKGSTSGVPIELVMSKPVEDHIRRVVYEDKCNSVFPKVRNLGTYFVERTTLEIVYCLLNLQIHVRCSFPHPHGFDHRS